MRAVVEVAALVAFALISGSAFLVTDDAKTSFPPIAIAALRLVVGSVGLLTITGVWYVVTKGGRRHMLDWASSRLRPGERARRGSAGSSLTVSNGFILDSGPGASSRGLAGTWMPIIAVGVFNTAIPYTLYGYGFDLGVMVGTAAIIAGSAPIMAAMLATCLLPAAALMRGPGAGRYAPSASYGLQLDLNADDLHSPFAARRSPRSPRASFGSTGFGTTGSYSGEARVTAPEDARALVRRIVGGLLLGFVGIILLSLRSFSGHSATDSHTVSQLVAGHAIIVFAIASKALASVIAHKYLSHLRVLPLALAQTVVGAVVCLVASLAVDYTGVETHEQAKDWQFLGDASRDAWMSILYLGLCSSCLVYVLQFFLVQQAGAVRQMLVDYMTPVVGVVEGAIFKHEFAHTTATTLLAEIAGVVCIAIGVVLVNNLCSCSRSNRGAGMRRSSELSDTNVGGRAADRNRMSVERPKAFSVTEVPPTEYPMFAAPTDRLMDNSEVHGGF